MRARDRHSETAVAGFHGLVLCALLWAAPALRAADEAALIGVLQSDQGLAEKDRACGELRVVGTAKAVPVLAALLTDKELGFSARYALAALPAPEALAALREALSRTAGLVKAGLIDSLGQRGDREAIPALTLLLRDADASMAAAAACSLGRIGGKEALTALQSVGKDVPEALRPALNDALLACAESLVVAGDTQAALAVCQQLYESDAPEHVRVGAYRRRVLSNVKEAGAWVEKALTGQDRAGLLAVLPLVRDLPSEEATRAFAGVLKKVPPATQVSLLEALTQRGDVTALPAMAEAAASADPAVRLSALEALGQLGDGSVVPVLAQAAAAAKGEERKAAVQALIRLKGPEIAPALLRALAKAEQPEQLVLLEVLRYRRDASAVAGLRELAEKGKGPVCEEALKALAVTAGGSFLPVAVELLRKAKSDGERGAAVALVSACARQVPTEAERAQPVLSALKEADGATRVALLGTLPHVGGAHALAAACEGLKDKNGETRLAAVRALADWPDASGAGDLLAAAKSAPGETEGILALRGYLRLLALPGDRPMPETVRLHQEAMKVARRAEEKRLVLSSLSTFCSVESVQAAEAYLSDAELKSEAVAALVSIAEGLASSDAAAAKAAIGKALAAGPPAQVREKAERILNAIDKLEDHLVSWMVSGPYQADGQGPQQLFDVAFDPEKADGKAQWRRLENATSAENPVIVDLRKALATENCVAYLRIQVVSPKAQDALLEIGSDDGVKVWLNGRLVHAVNVLRACQPGQEKVKVTLKEGAHVLMLKITQGGMGWGASARFRAPDGGKLPGLRIQVQ